MVKTGVTDSRLEAKVAKRVRLSRVQKAIIATIGAVGVLGVAALAPNAVQLLGPVAKKVSRAKQNSIVRARNLLLKKKLITKDPARPDFLTLTRQGIALASKLRHAEYRIPRPRRWDGKWRVLIFDISERQKKARDAIRITLTHLGFVRLQDSVWAYPYPCEEFVSLLKADFKIGYSLLYLIVEEMEGDRRIRKSFNLPHS